MMKYKISGIYLEYYSDGSIPDSVPLGLVKHRSSPTIADVWIYIALM